MVTCFACCDLHRSDWGKCFEQNAPFVVVAAGMRSPMSFTVLPVWVVGIPLALVRALLPSPGTCGQPCPSAGYFDLSALQSEKDRAGCCMSLGFFFYSALPSLLFWSLLFFMRPKWHTKVKARGRFASFEHFVQLTTPLRPQPWNLVYEHWVHGQGLD